MYTTLGGSAMTRGAPAQTLAQIQASERGQGEIVA